MRAAVERRGPGDGLSPCATLLALGGEAADGVRLSLVGLEHGQELRDREQVRDALRQVQQLELTALPGHRCVRSDDRPEAGAVDIGHFCEVEQQLPVALDRKSTRLNSSH